MMDHNHFTIKTFMAITAERDAAIRERNMALEERKRAFQERDMEMLQRDVAITERNAAIQERDEAIAALQFRENSFNEYDVLPDTSGNELPSGDRHIPYHQMHVSESSRVDELIVTEATETEKSRKGSQPNEGKPSKSSKSARIGKRSGCKPLNSVASIGWNKDRVLESDEEDLDKSVSWKENLGLNQISFDESAMPVPVCTCTGSPQPCYRWGSGGWQSACCTTTISMYPLPQAANRRYSRVGGRKMSGSAFSKLLNRLAAKGYDFSTPLDLKSHWAKHGTNRYSTLK